MVSIRTGAGSGTGFVVDTDGTIVTNAHVVGDSDSVQVQFSDDRTATGTVRGVDRSSDLAIVRVTGESGLTALELADSDTVRTGQLAVAIGSPFGLPQTATAGIVSGTGRHIQAPDGFQIDSVIQTDAPINPGNSGGPLLDAAGQVIGVNSQIATGGTSQGNVGIGFAVPANTVADVIPRLERGEAIQRPYLGLSTAAGSGGAVVREATAGGPAADAGHPRRRRDRRGRRGAGARARRRRRRDPGPRAGRPRRGRAPARRRRAHGDRRAGRAAGAGAVTFASPWLLLGLALLPLLVLAAVAAERRRRRAAAHFAAPATRASVVPRGPGGRRHVPLLLAGLAIAGLIVALARPQISTAVPAEQASIVLTMDHSGSMQATDVAPSRLVAAREAGEAFLGSVPAKVRVGGVVFDHRTEVVSDPTTDRAGLRQALRDAMVPSGGTATGDALAASLAMLDAQRGAGAKRPPGAIVLLSDGESTSGRDPLAVAEEAREQGVPVYTVALGTAGGTLPDGQAVPPDTAVAAPDRRALRRAGVHRAGRERAQRRLRAAGLAGRDEAGAARDHRRVRRRSDRAAADRRRPVAALVPAADLRGA